MRNKNKIHINTQSNRENFTHNSPPLISMFNYITDDCQYYKSQHDKVYDGAGGGGVPCISDSTPSFELQRFKRASLGFQGKKYELTFEPGLLG